jgi:hypothetical protein
VKDRAFESTNRREAFAQSPRDLHASQHAG